MRHIRTVTAILAAGLLTVGCGGSEDGNGGSGTQSSAEAGNSKSDKSDRAEEGERLPVVVESPAEKPVGINPTISPTPERDADFTEKVIHELRERTVRMAGVMKSTSGSCEGGEITLKAKAATECTIAYADVEIPWTVTISDSYKEGSFFIQYNAEPGKGLLTGEGVRAKLWEDNHQYSDEMRCEELPEAEVVDLDADTGYKCQLVNEKSDGSGEYTVDMAVKVKRGGPWFDRLG
ncbi:hypothetical protein ACLIYP_21050 [Streptomyces nanhaiensis]|uniref:hypothetical protein n=1 Tax=Streptomyces nanhaiensis TaxID=679319 RepID=UPI00399C6905